MTKTHVLVTCAQMLWGTSVFVGFKDNKLLNWINFSYVPVHLLNGHKNKKYDVVLFLCLGYKNVLETIGFLKQNFKNSKLVVHSNFDEADFIAQLYFTGISGHVTSEDGLDELAKAIHEVKLGGTYQSACTVSIIASYYMLKQQTKTTSPLAELTLRETEIFKYLCNGKTNAEIAEELFVSIDTIRTHRNNIYHKLGLHAISDLMIYARKNNIDIAIPEKGKKP